MFSIVTSTSEDVDPLQISNKGVGEINSFMPASLSPSQERKQLAVPPNEPLYSIAICLRLLVPLAPLARTENQ